MKFGKFMSYYKRKIIIQIKIIYAKTVTGKLVPVHLVFAKN